MPRLPYYAFGGVAVGAIYYGVTQWVYEPYTTVQVAAESALEAGIFFNQRFLQRAQLLSRELTDGKSGSMMSLFCRCMLLREDALREEVLHHDALFRVIDETMNHRCLPLRFREDDMTSWQVLASAAVYSCYLGYFHLVGKCLDAISQLLGQPSALAVARRHADAFVALMLLRAISAPVQLLDWRSENVASEQRGQLVDRELDKGELTDAQQTLEQSNRGQKHMFEMYSVTMSHDDKVEAMAKMQAATRGVCVPTHLYLVHVSHWLEDLAARASFPKVVKEAPTPTPSGSVPVLVTLHRPTAESIREERRALAAAFHTMTGRSNLTDGSIRRADADDFDNHDAAYKKKRGVTQSQGILDSVLAQNNFTNYAVSMREAATHMFRFGYPWAASTEQLRAIFSEHKAEFASPLLVSGSRLFIDMEGEAGTARRAAERAQIEAEKNVWKTGREMATHSNLADAESWGTIPKEAQEKRVKRRSRMVEQMRLDDEAAAREAEKASKHQTTGERKDYFEIHADAIPATPPAAETPSLQTAFGDPNAGQTSATFDTPLTNANPEALSRAHASVAQELREAVVKVAASAERRRHVQPASQEEVPPEANWRVYGGRLRGVTRTLRVIVSDPVTADAVWTSQLKAAQRLQEAESEALRYQPSSLGAM